MTVRRKELAYRLGLSAVHRRYVEHRLKASAGADSPPSGSPAGPSPPTPEPSASPDSERPSSASSIPTDTDSGSSAASTSGPSSESAADASSSSGSGHGSPAMSGVLALRTWAMSSREEARASAVRGAVTASSSWEAPSGVGASSVMIAFLLRRWHGGGERHP